MRQSRRRSRRVLAVCAAFALVLAACGGDDDDDAGATDDTEAEAGDGDDTGDDSGGDKGMIGYVVAGDRADGGFYQGQVEAVEQTADDLGYEVTIVDKVNPGAAQEAFENLARQEPVLIIAGGSELRDGFVPVSESPEYSDITFVLVAGYPPDADTYATVGANENEAHFVGGVASALLLQRADTNTACVVAGPELDFVKNMAAAMTAGLAHVDESLEMLVTYTGDFEDANLALEAANAQINQGCQVVYPYLGGALDAVVKAGNDAGIDVVATSIDRCADTTREFSMAILYNPSLYLANLVESFEAGEIVEGEQLALYGVGDGVDVGATLCDASAEEQQVLDDAIEGINSGDIDVAALLGTNVSG